MAQSSWQPPVAFADDGSEVVSQKRVSLRSSGGSSSAASSGSKSFAKTSSFQSSIGSSTSSSSSSPVDKEKKPHKEKWLNKIFVVDEESSDMTSDKAPSKFKQQSSSIIHSISSSLSSSLNSSITRPKALTRKNTIITDPTLLKTRLKWNQELVGKAFRPYKLLMAQGDKDLPHTEEDLTLLESNVEQDILSNEYMRQCREEMLKDASLTEREIAAFFEGLKLYALKANSLKSQLDGAQSRERFRSQSIMRAVSKRSQSRSMILEDDAADGEGDEGFVPTTLAPMRSSMPPPRQSPVPKEQDQDEIQMPMITKLQSSAPARMQSSVPRRNLSQSLRHMSIRRVKESSEVAGDEKVQQLLKDLEEAEARQKKLEKQLQQAGVQIAEDIPYEEAKEQVRVVAARMNEIGGSQSDDPKLREEYFKLEQEMEKCTTALQLTDEWAKEQEDMERDWEESCHFDNITALRKIRRCMPVDVRNLTEHELTSIPSPNGNLLPADMAKKFKRTNILQILRMNPDDIVRMHPSTLENMRVTGLTLTERRALYAHLKEVGQKWLAKKTDQMFERKFNWFNMMKGNFKEVLYSYERHVEQYGPPENHTYATRDDPDSGCPLIGKQCPIRADRSMNYDLDYGYPEGDEYFSSDIKKSAVDDVDKERREALESLREKKALERSDALKQHFKGNVMQIALANGSAESMDEAMDLIEDLHTKWIKAQLGVQGEISEYDKKREISMLVDALHELKLSMLQFSERSGMQLTGKRDANRDQPDNRSMVELCLCEEFLEVIADLFRAIEKRVDDVGLSDGRMLSTVNQLYSLADELGERTQQSIQILSSKLDRPPRSRKMKTHATIRKEVLESSKHHDEDHPEIENQPQHLPPPPLNGDKNHDLLQAIAKRGKKSRGGGSEEGPPSFLAAIAARGAVE